MTRGLALRIFRYFNLEQTQATLDFVDVDVKKDTPLFISPKALTMLHSDFGDECVHLIQNFFHKILELINARRNAEAESLLGVLREPNETHLGLSKGSKSRGRALGEGSAHEVWSALSESEAATKRVAGRFGRYGVNDRRNFDRYHLRYNDQHHTRTVSSVYSANV